MSCMLADYLGSSYSSVLCNCDWDHPCSAFASFASCLLMAASAIQRMGTGPTVMSTPTKIVEPLKMAAHVKFPPLALIKALPSATC